MNRKLNTRHLVPSLERSFFQPLTNDLASSPAFSCLRKELTIFPIPVSYM